MRSTGAMKYRKWITGSNNQKKSCSVMESNELSLAKAVAQPRTVVKHKEQ